MTRTTVSAALGDRYDTRYLIDGSQSVEGFTLEFADVGKHPWFGFREMVTNLPWDIGEQALSHYIIARDRGKPLTAIPVFPSYFFPLMGAVVRRDAGIDVPRDLEGRRVGVMGFGYNPAVWLRGILSRHYGVDTTKIIWVEDDEDRFLGGLNYPRGTEFRIERIGAFNSLHEPGSEPGGVAALEAGKIDAFFAPAGGPPLSAETKYLFPDRLEACREWYAATGVFPINTVVTLRTESVEKYPELAPSLFDALVAARARYHVETADPEHLGIPLEFLRAEGLFPSRYDLDANRMAIEMMLDFCAEQGVISDRPTADSLFCLNA